MDEKDSKPDYYILAPDSDSTKLVSIGAAWVVTDKSGAEYISGTLNARPWGTWNGKIQIHRIKK